MTQSPSPEGQCSAPGRSVQASKCCSIDPSRAKDVAILIGGTDIQASGAQRGVRCGQAIVARPLARDH